MKSLLSFFGSFTNQSIKRLQPLVNRINELEKIYQSLSSDDLKNKTGDFRKLLQDGVSLDELLPDAFAVVREAAKRTLKQRHFDVQLMGGIMMHQGTIAEMRTGEGKTLTATLAAYLNALPGKGVHIVTVNEYLARRDTTWMGRIYHMLGLTIGCINNNAAYVYDPEYSASGGKNENLPDGKAGLDAQEISPVGGEGAFRIFHDFLKPVEPHEAYACDITHGTNDALGFDYLRDNMEYSVASMRQRGHYFAIVDEVDSILIDEARTPLIISAPDEQSADLYKTFSRIVPNLKAEIDYTIDEKMRAVSITDSGIEKIESTLNIENLYTEGGIKYVHHLEQALRAQALFKKDKDYVVKQGQIIIVDEFTGRLMPGRRWSDGLHQAVEAKEGVVVQQESRTYASITFQNYFRLYKKLSGMTGTALSSAEEFRKVYNLDVVSIPTHQPMIRRDLQDQIFQTEEGKWIAVARTIKETHATGQPVLVGTVSIEKNEKLSALLKREGVSHVVLNAKNHEQEGELIAQAGKFGAVTVATNMAGRGVDIILGGDPLVPEDAQKVKSVGGLFVLGTERHEARRIDNQLRGRAGRQGDSGSSVFLVSLEDDLMRIFGPDRIKRLMGTFGIPEDQSIENKMISRAIESAQAKIEGFNFDARKRLLEFDDVMNKQRMGIYNRRKEILFADEVFLREKCVELIGDKTNSLGDLSADKAGLERVRRTFLQALDILWVDHLEAMEYMRSSVSLRAYGQRDPLVEYQHEGKRLFAEFQEHWKKMVERLLLHEEQPIHKHQQPAIKISSAPNAGGKKVGRNDLCPCGSGKKYKKCHGK